jgi:lysophospholipase L1-like esterase
VNALWQTAPRLVVLGDSITSGVGVAPSQAWPSLVASALHRTLINVAVSGTTAAQQIVPNVAPGNLVIWLVGYNDMRQGTDLTAFRATVASGVARLQAAGAVVVLASGLRMTSAGYSCCGANWGHGSDAQAANYANAIRDLTAFVDLSGIAPSPVADQIHPDPTEQAAIAQAIRDQIPPLAATWQGDTLIVTAEPGCLYLVGGLRRSQFVDCNQAEYRLPMWGDQGFTPIGRTLVLMSLDGQTETARLKVPSRFVVWMPWVAG